MCDKNKNGNNSSNNSGSNNSSNSNQEKPINLGYTERRGAENTKGLKTGTRPKK
ncbi:hypothetical protein [Pseudotamlana agarivorans]|uniref:hypothetical protein n=1 Tax=Pseudotamlana agarivorans TaxID=481183 RepID=UPI0012F8AE5C|nr:hypothetical protein [Tamlana agarivorans]